MDIQSTQFPKSASRHQSTRQESFSWDEGDTIYSGYMNRKHREYSLNPEPWALVTEVH